MIAFLDFEASSLNKKSFPVEVAWVFEDGRHQSHLIRPHPDWTDWSDEAEGLHGISRERLEQEGVAVETVAQQMLSELGAHQLFASAPSWDGKWLSALLRAGGLPRHSLRLKKSDEAFFDVARLHLGEHMSDAEISALVEGVIRHTEPSKPLHRALPDALLERDRFQFVALEAVKRMQTQ